MDSLEELQASNQLCHHCSPFPSEYSINFRPKGGRHGVPQPCHAVPIFPPASQDSMISNRPAGNITESFDFSLIETNLRSPIVERGNKFSTRSDRRFDRSPIPRWLDRTAPHGVRAFFARINFPWRGVETNAHSGSPVGRDPGGITSRLTEIRLSKFSIIGSRL